MSAADEARAEVANGTVARIRVDRGATTEFPVAEKVHGGWQTGVHRYPDETVSKVLGVYVHQSKPGRNVLVAATAEANAKYQGDVDCESGDPVDDCGYSGAERQAFVIGALWQASRPVPDERVEAAAKAAFAVAPLIYNAGDWVAKDWDADWLDEATRDIWRAYARGALEAARGADS